MLRLAAALRAGFGEDLRLAIAEAPFRDQDAQWLAALPVVAEAEGAAGAPARHGRPRRVLHLPNGVTVRREKVKGGYLLRFSGPHAGLDGDGAGLLRPRAPLRAGGRGRRERVVSGAAGAAMELRRIPLAEIDAGATLRDREGVDPEPLDELCRSIVASGLRQPIEVFALAEPRPPLAWGLISGYRRLLAFQRLMELTGQERYAAIPAFVRAAMPDAEELIAVVEENAVRAPVSAFERGRVAVAARDAGLFPSVEAAVERLYAAASRRKRARMRALARLAEALGEVLAAPERLSEARALRLAAAVQGGHGPMLAAMLAGVRDPDAQWRALLPVLAAVEGEQEPAPGPSRPRRARRRWAAAPLVIRREACPGGSALRFTGPEATEVLMDAAMARVLWLMGPI